MFILRILLKAALLPVVLILLIVKVIVKVGMHLSSIVLGGLILFVAGCLIYTITKQAWSQTFLLALPSGLDRSRYHGHYDRDRRHREPDRCSIDGNCRHLKPLLN